MTICIGSSANEDFVSSGKQAAKSDFSIKSCCDDKKNARLDPSDCGVRSFLATLPKEQTLVLDWFFRNCLQSFGGYVLCGNKPMCIEEIPKGSSSLKFSEWMYAKILAFQLLKKWHSQPDNKYIFLFCDYYNYSHMIIINRESFINTVNTNISLFRYILGRTLTAELLLNELVINQNRFWDILKDNNALIGILLGYGTNNALIHSRGLDLSKKQHPPQASMFPYFYSSVEGTPSLGFSSIEEEITTLGQLQDCSRDILTYSSYEVPCFGCEPESEETRLLLSTYEKNHAQIIQVAKQEDFLEKMLEKVFTTTSGKIRIPPSAFKSTPFRLTEIKDLSNRLAEVIRSEADVKGASQDFLLSSFVRGAEEREKNRPSPQSVGEELVLESIIPAQLECCKNLLSANRCAQQLSLQKSWVSLVSGGILYKVLRKGCGSPATSKIQNATFHISFRPIWEKKYVDSKTIKQADIQKLVPGIAHSLIGMRKGEERLIWIHPRYAYGINAQPFNTPFFAEVHLIDFEEGETEAQILPPAPLEPSYCFMNQGDSVQKPLPPLGLDALNNQGIQQKYNELFKTNQKSLASKFYQYGYSFWNLAKRIDPLIKYEDFKRQLTTSPTKYFKDHNERDEFVKNVKISLFSEDYEKGKEPPFPLAWF